MIETIPAAHLFFTAAMTGLIWFVQVAHYPLFAHVDESVFTNYQHRHMKRTTYVVAPLMIGELVTTMALFKVGFIGVPHTLTIACMILLAISWGSTALLQVPCHRKLEKGFDADAHRKLVRSNWIRTTSWTIKSVLAVGLLVY